PDNLHEIKELTGEGLTYPTAGQLREWLSTYFRIVHEEEGNIALTFRHPLEVLRHLKYTGVTANASCVWTRGKQERFCRDYQERFPSADGGVTLTYRPLYILVVKR
ncbi:malonyl-[acyl-carrier protein] O-methyltransferase BioC, partial [Parabacteroides distasonis]